MAEAKARLRRAVSGRAAADGALAVDGVRLFARTRPWAALGAALVAGVVVGASRSARAALPRLLLRLLA